MSVIPEPRQLDPDIISVAKFAEKYRVDASIVRGWIRMGYINYVLDGAGRQMRKIRVSEVVKPLIDPVPPVIPPDPNQQQQEVTNESGSEPSDSGGADGTETGGTEGDASSAGHSETGAEVAGRAGNATGSTAAPKTSGQRPGNRHHRR